MNKKTKAELGPLKYKLLKYKLASDALGIGHWDFEIADSDPASLKNKIIYSAEFRRMLGFSDENDFPNLLSSWSSRLHPDDKDITLKAFSAHINDRTGATPYNLEFRLMVKNGDYRCFHAFGTTVRDENGKPQVVAGAIHDITEKKLVEAELAEEYRKSKAMSYWYEAILDATPLPITVTDANMNWTFVNKAVENFLGTKREDMIGKPCSNWNAEICNTPDCGVACAKRGLKQTYFKHQNSSYQVDVEIIRNIEGEIAGFIEVVQDITKIEHMARFQADAANDAKSAFLATMSHEIRTPLNAIIGMTTIGMKTSDTEAKNNALTKISVASAHLLAIVNDILDMSKIEASKLELSPISFNFERMLLKVLAVIEHRVEERRQRLTVNVEQKIPLFIIGDDQRLAQVITNLLSNAVKFTPDEGEIFLDVTMAGKENGLCELRIEVRDSGIGMSPEQQKNIFVAFSQADSGVSRKYGGTGLGLVISQRIVESMGGIISVQSVTGKGSLFSFCIKVPYSDENKRSLLDPGIPWKTLRVLVASDSAPVRQYFQDSFNVMDIQCITSSDGMEACRIIEEQGSFDIYFIDWQISNMDSAALIKWIKSNKMSGKIVLCCFTEIDNLQEAALKAGADRYLTKPLLTLSIIDCINACLGHTTHFENQEQHHDFAGKTILVVEDIEINREIILSLLEDTGLSIECAENGKEALDMISAAPGKFNAVFMDLQMPVMDGLEATTHIRALPEPECKTLPIIAMTANVFKEDIERCLAAGMNGHIGKPLNLEEVFKMLRRYLSDLNS